MLFWNKICGFIAIFFLSVLFSSGQSGSFPKLSSLYFFPNKSISLNKISDKEARNLLYPLAVLPANFYMQQLGFICKKEWAIEKATKIPFRFRLGSLQQCNYLEGKK